jgi:hypothetical protein
VVLETTGQGTQCHCQEDKYLHLFKELVEWRDQREEEPTGKRQEEEAHIGGNSLGEDRIAEVDSESKGRIWHDYLKNLRGAEFWRAAKFAKVLAGATVGALTDRDGKQAYTITKIRAMRSRKSCSPNEHGQYCELTSAGRPHQSVAE